MANKKKFTKTKMMKALQDSKGIKVIAALRLGCTRQTIDNYINEDPEIKAIYDEQRDVIVDIAESKWLQKINEGSWDAIKFALITLGKNRGYDISQKLDFDGSLDIHITIPELKDEN